MLRRLEELDRFDERARAAGVDPLRAWLDVQSRPAPRRSWLREHAVTVVVVAVVLALAGWFGVPRYQHDRQAAVAAARQADRPTAGVGERSGRVLPAVPVSTQGEHAFLQTQPDGGPVTWDPCREIHYVVSGTGPPGADALVAGAMSLVTQASGLQLIADGSTTELSDFSRPKLQPERYGDRWAPVLVAWTTPEREPDLAGGVVGLGSGLVAADRSGHGTYVSGALALDTAQISEVLARDPGGHRVSAVVMHEMGHVLGLAHVTDPTQLMAPAASASNTVLGAGDRQGLALLGAGRCAPTL
ncbi:matrixin family metalloprotease [Angustibacter aerolatus]